MNIRCKSRKQCPCICIYLHIIIYIWKSAEIQYLGLVIDDRNRRRSNREMKIYVFLRDRRSRSWFLPGWDLCLPFSLSTLSRSEAFRRKGNVVYEAAIYRAHEEFQTQTQISTILSLSPLSSLLSLGMRSHSELVGAIWFFLEVKSPALYN